MTITEWPSKVREHRSWSEEPTELTDWYVHGRRRVATQAAHNPRKDPA